VAVLATGALAVMVVACATSPPNPSATAPRLATEALASTLIDFARARDEPSFADVPFATEVALALGGEVRLRRVADELLDPSAWLIDPGPDGFRERVGPFSALDVVADGAVTMSTGRHGTCTAADERLPPPPELSTLQVVSIQPDRRVAATCMQWWAVDIFITDSGRIAGVDLDLGAP